MDEKARAQTFFAATLITPIAAWLLTAKLIYGITPETVREDLSHLLGNTFNLWPLWCALLIGAFAGMTLALLIIKFNKQVFAGAHFQRFYRGTKLTDPAALSKKTKEPGKTQITIAGIPVPTKAENHHFSVAGATGTGKSTLLKEMMFGILRRGDRMVITDPDGDFLKAFYRPGIDKILNPFDSRSEGWSFFNEIRETHDFEAYAKSIIQSSSSKEAEEWNEYGRLLFQEVARKVFNTARKPTIRDVFAWTNQKSPEELEEFVKGTTAQALFTGNERATSSVRFVLSKQLAPHLKMTQGNFSIRDWLEDPEGGNLFITWDETSRVALRPIISCWVDTVFTSFLGLSTDVDRRLWTFLDELESLDCLPTLGAGLTKGRKKGLSVVTGYQSYAQVIRIYGDEMAETLLGQHRTTVALAVGRMGEKTADRLSKALGEHEVMRQRGGTSRRWGAAGTKSQSDEIKMERVVSSSEIMALPDLEGYVAFPGDLPIAKFKTQPVNYRRADDIPGILKTREVLG